MLANDTDIDGGPISIDTVTQPANGTVVITGSGTGAHLPTQPELLQHPAGSAGSPLDTFTYTLTPGTSTATVSVTVTCVNDAPTITLSGSTPTFTEGGPAVTVDAGLTVTDVDDTSLGVGHGVDHRRRWSPVTPSRSPPPAGSPTPTRRPACST